MQTALYLDDQFILFMFVVSQMIFSSL